MAAMIPWDMTTGNFFAFVARIRLILALLLETVADTYATNALPTPPARRG
jgi:hypothetical protein